MTVYTNPAQQTVALLAAENPAGFISFLTRWAATFEPTTQGIIRFLIAQPDLRLALERLSEKQAFTLYYEVSVCLFFTPTCEDCETHFSWDDMPADQPCGYCESVKDGINKA